MIQERRIAIPHDGRHTDAKVFVPGGEGPFPFVIISHGYNGHGDDHVYFARLLAESGIGAVTHTFCGGSTRDVSGFPTESMTLFTECDDLKAVLDCVRGMSEADPDRIALWGESQGGLVTVMTAAKYPEDMRAVCLLYPALCIPDNWRSKSAEARDFWGMRLGRDFFVTLRDIDVMSLPGLYSGPVLIMHGDKDPIVPLGYSERAAALFPDARLEVFPGEGHGFSPSAYARMAKLGRDFIADAMRCPRPAF